MEPTERHLSIMRVIAAAPNGVIGTDSIAQRLGYRPVVSGRLSVNASLRALERGGFVGRIPPRDQWGHAKWCLLQTGRLLTHTHSGEPG